MDVMSKHCDDSVKNKFYSRIIKNFVQYASAIWTVLISVAVIDYYSTAKKILSNFYSISSVIASENRETLVLRGCVRKHWPGMG